MSNGTRMRELLAEMLAITNDTWAIEPPKPAGPLLLNIHRGDNLQAALDQASSYEGEVYLNVEPAIYGAVTLGPSKARVFVSPNTAEFTGTTKRVSPEYAPAMIGLQAVGQQSAITFLQGANDYYLLGVRPLPGDPSYPLITVGNDFEADPLMAPQRNMFDRVLLQADALKGGKRGMALNCGAVSVRDSYIGGFFWVDDSQAIGATNGPGPFVIDNCYLEAAGENFMLGGGTIVNPAMHMADLTFTRNYVSKQLAWKGKVGATVKNAFELKSLRKALIKGNIFEDSWKSGQDGALIAFTPRSQYGKSPFASIEDIDFVSNIVRNGGAGYVITGDDNEFPSGKLQRVRIVNNLTYNIDPSTYPSTSKRLVFVSRGPVDVTVQHNTMLGKGLNSFLTLDGPTKASNLQFNDNVVDEGTYGVMGSAGPGAASWAAWTDEKSMMMGNLIQRQLTAQSYTYPVGNVKGVKGEAVIDGTLMCIPKYGVNMVGGVQTTDGKNVGADIAQVLAETGGVL